MPDVTPVPRRFTLSRRRFDRRLSVSETEERNLTTAPQTELSDNPLLVEEGLPPFDRIAPPHVVPAVRRVLATAEIRLQGVESHVSPTWSGTIEALDRLGQPFQYAWGPVSHLMGVMNSPELREAHETVLGEMVSFGLRVNQSEPVYNALKALQASP